MRGASPCSSLAFASAGDAIRLFKRARSFPRTAAYTSSLCGAAERTARPGARHNPTTVTASAAYFDIGAPF